MNKIIEVRNLEKMYGDKKVLKGLSFDVYEGEVLCILGPNGAGKSTTINILSTAIGRDGGSILFYGKDEEKNVLMVKKNLGIVPQDIALYEDISAEKNVRFFASLYGLRGKLLDERTKEALEFVGLLDRKDDKPKTFSGGMKRRLNIACAIAHRPKVIIMDEPTVGIDPQSRNHILDSIKRLKKSGSTIIYTTHYMEEVEEISTRIIIIDHGQKIAEGTNESLKEKLGDSKMYSIYVEDSNNISKNDLCVIDGVKDAEIGEKEICITSIKDAQNLDKIISVIINKNLKISNITSNMPSLETVFLNLTGRKLRD